MGKVKYLRVLESLLGIVAFGFVVFPKLSGLLIIVLSLYIILGYFKKKIHFKLNTISILLILYYSLYLIGVIFTHNQHQANIYLENKLSFVIFPLVFSFKSVKINLKFPFLGFILGTTIVLFSGINNSLNCYSSTGLFECFLATKISPVHHPTYLAAYVFFSMGIMWCGLQLKLAYFSLKWILPLGVFFIIIHGFILSFSGLLYLIVTLLVFLLYQIKKRNSRFIFYLSILILPLLGYVSITEIPQIKGEWFSTKQYVDMYVKNPSKYVENRKYPMASSEIRIVMWIASINVFLEHPFGVGTGNVDEYLDKELIKLKQPVLIQSHYNPHNQFLQTGIEIGFIGLLILLSIIGFSTYFAFKHRNWLLLLLVGSLFFNSLFESMLQRQSGIVFYSFWICLLVLYSNQNSEQKIIEENGSTEF